MAAPVRAADAARLAAGVLLLARPALPARLTGTPPSGTVRTLTRVIAARYLLQGAVGAAVGATGSAEARRRVRAADTVVEVLHAASMVPAALVFRDQSRLAAASGLVALAAAAADAPRAGG